MLTTLSLAKEESSAPVRRRPTTRAELWVSQALVAAVFLLTGTAKLAGAPMMVTTFEHIGLGQWFRYVTGVIEVLSAAALLVPSSAAFGAVTLAGTMIGAVATHMLVTGGSPVPALILLAATVSIAFARRDDLRRALSALGL